MIDSAGQLRAIRSRFSWTHEALAKFLGVSAATVIRWENGASRPQKAALEAIEKLARTAGDGAADAPQTPATRVASRPATGAPGIPTTKPMEQMLWDAACSIRGEKDAAKFKDYLLPLLFLKRLSDVFDDELARLAEEYGDRATALEIAEADHELLRFYLPHEARWAVISGREGHDWPEKEKPRDIGEHLTKAVRAVAKHNPTLSGVIDVVDFAAQRNEEREVNPAKLRTVVEAFSDPRYRLGLADVPPDFLGRAYEYLLRKFAEGSGQSAGEFFTPTEVGFLIAHLMRPRPGEECHDYACGSAGLLVKLQLVARTLDPQSRVPLRLSGQELQAESYAVAHERHHPRHAGRARARRHDDQPEVPHAGRAHPHARRRGGEPDVEPVLPARRARERPVRAIRQDGRRDQRQGRLGLAAAHAGVPERDRAGGRRARHRRGDARLGLEERGQGAKHPQVVRRPRPRRRRHPAAGQPLLQHDGRGVVVVLARSKPAARTGKLVLFNASRRVRKGRPKNYIPEEDIAPIAAAFLKGEPADGEIAVITKEQAKDADYNLSPNRWVGKTEDAEHRPIPEILAELAALDAEGREVGASLAKMLGRLGERRG